MKYKGKNIIITKNKGRYDYTIPGLMASEYRGKLDLYPNKEVAIRKAKKYIEYFTKKEEE